ncbi:hypothetical protein, partial [Stenotrophomonas sp. Ste60]|uniref:hypothetical protein n=1 Tax=Stenotrophomonas sp. Ste60 TaxID=2926026 RepID=UPI002119AD1B
LAPEASASTNSATWATQEENSAGELKLCQQHVAENFDGRALPHHRAACRESRAFQARVIERQKRKNPLARV